ncbi:MAG TPA: polyhydroxyalkanoic acid system family protein [Caulobacteraceae bacterium]|nr:polyhydroxyalkanoic acid system family protein [Caulobacteraceae bacterium]
MSKPLTIDIPHKLGVAEARQRIESGFGQLTSQMPAGMGQVEKSWKDNRLTFSATAMGQVVTGHLDVLEDAVHMVVHLPGFLGMLAGKIAPKIQRQGQILLEKK